MSHKVLPPSDLWLHDAFFPWLTPVSMHRMHITYINLSVDPFQKGRSRSHESREPFYSLSLTTLLIYNVMPRVKRRPGVNVSSVPLLSRDAFLLVYFRLPLQFRANTVKMKVKDMASFQSTRTIEANYFSTIYRKLLKRWFILVCSLIGFIWTQLIYFFTCINLS